MPDVKFAAAQSSRSGQEPDAHGQAALLLAESILHALVDSGTLTNREAITVMRTACEVKTEVATAAGESKVRMNESLDLLERMANSLESDEPKSRSKMVLHAVSP